MSVFCVYACACVWQSRMNRAGLHDCHAAAPTASKSGWEESEGPVEGGQKKCGVWAGSVWQTPTHTHTTNSIRFLFMSPSLPYSHYTVQQIMKNYIKKFISHSSVLIWTPAFHLLILHFSMKGKLWTCRHVTLEELGVCVSDASLTGVSHYEVLSNSATWR